MTLGTLARYLIGDRTAILTLVRQRGALLVGALLVLSAGIASIPCYNSAPSANDRVPVRV